jgi:hypothetical protein
MPTPTNASSSLQELLAAQFQLLSQTTAKMDLDGVDSPWGGKSMFIAGITIKSGSLPSQMCHQAQPLLSLQILQDSHKSQASQPIVIPQHI